MQAREKKIMKTQRASDHPLVCCAGAMTGRKENNMEDRDYGVSTVEELREIMKQYQEENGKKEE